MPDVQAIVSPADPQTRAITHDRASLKIRPSAVRLPVGIGITSLAAHEVPELDPGMTNVTARPRSGYRFTPHPMTFAEPIEVSLPYDPALLGDEFTPQDVYTYYFDEAGECWRALQRVTVDEANHLVISLTDHFTDMINSAVMVPEHPEGASFNPNEIKGIQAADPGSGINLIAPPQMNNQGDNRLSYPIEIPPGRNGFQPQLGLSYDSGRGNGWMGVGWDLTTPHITIDTRWGVPRYEAATETESYLLNGEQLTPVAHRSAPAARSADKVFHTRVEGGFARIVRRGDSPGTYTWEVTDKAGTKWFYGTDAESVLADGDGNAYVWALREVVDTHGNLMRYHYATVDDPGIDGGAEPGRNLYPKRITYTGSNGIEGRYSVTFIRDRELQEPLRVDKQIDARGGFKRVTADLLRKVEVALDGALVRRYEFGYTTGAFHKTLLGSLSQFDADGALFHTHTFDYFDDIRDTDGRYQAFGSLPWNSPGDGLSKSALNLTGERAGDASAINANTSAGGGGHLYVGVGSSPSKSGSVGLKVGFSHSEDSGLLALVDVDGDSLPDKVFRDGGTTWYRKNMSGPGGQAQFAAQPTPLSLPGIMDESSNTVTLGIEGFAGGVAAQLDYVNTFSRTNQYFSDVNGDSIMDLVTGSSVLFGRIGPDGVPVYGVSGDTPVPIGSGEVDPDGLFGDFAADRERLEDSFPLLDSVRRWVAPYDGTVRIEGAVRLTTAPGAALADGVRVAIQHEDTELWSEQIGPQDGTEHAPTGVSAVNVSRGQRIYFRVQSIFDGSQDRVGWDPLIRYLNVTDVDDVNGLPGYRFQASRDFTLGGRSSSVKVPVTGTMHLSGDLTKRGTTTDDITVIITADGTSVFEQSLAGAATGTIPIGFDLQVQTGQTLKWRVKADSPIDLDQIEWTPRAHYTAAQGLDRVTDTNGNPMIDLFPPYDLDMYPINGLTAPQGFYAVPAAAQLTVAPQLAFDFGSAQPTARVAFTVKRRGELIAKRFFDIQNGQVTSPAAFPVQAEADDELFFDFSTLDPGLRQFLTGQSVEVDTVPVPSAFHSAAVEDAFPQPYRGWGAIGYNGNKARAGQPIVQSDLVVDEDFGDQLPDGVDPPAQRDDFAADPRINPPKVTPFAPFPQHRRWGSGDHSWVSRDAVSSSRMGTQSIYLPRTSDLSGIAVPRLSRSEQISLTGSVGGGVGTVGGSVAFGDSTGQVDFIDMNGDQFPDAVGANGIQYSEMFGGLGARRGSMPDGAVRKSSNVSGNASAGSPARTITTGRGYGSPPGHSPTNTAQAGNDMPPLGIGGNIGGSSSDGNFDLIDVNGDSLPDRIYSDGRVALNLGYRFGAPEQWRNPAALNDGSGVNFGLNVGFNTDFYGFAGGASYSEGSSSTASTLMDMNGDGLMDRVFAGPPLRVGLNTGNGFEPPVEFHGSLSALNGDQNAKLGGGVYFTIPICFIAICIIINPGGDIATGASRTEFALRDINGDGYADHLASTRDNELAVASNRTERTNLLRSVSRPLGAKLDFDYTRDGNTYGQPQSRWVLTRVSVHDGQPGDGQDVMLTTYEYNDGVYDRLEREFFGYGRVAEHHRDAGNGDAVYRSVTREFRTDSHYTRGLMREELTSDAAGRPFVETEHTYTLHEVGGGIADPKSTTATVFPQLTRTDQRFYEGNPAPGKSTHTTMQYDEAGNMTRSFDAADEGTDDDVETRISYTATDPACQATHIIGVANGIDVFGAGVLMRRRASTVDCVTGDVTQVRAELAGGATATTDLEYFADGNLRAVTGPPNENNQRYRLDYRYDPLVATHVETITDSFGYRSRATYHLKFGLVESTSDFNNQVIRSTYDAAGRLDTVTGPYEAPENRVTIDFEYHPEAPVPYAITRHVDRMANGAVRPDTIDTIVFIDGLKRATQTKKDASLHTAPHTAPQVAMVVSGRVGYDFLGRQVKQHYPVSEGKGAGNTTFNPAFDPVPPTTVTFDVMDRPVHIELPDATTLATSHGFGEDRGGVPRFEQISTDTNGKAKRTYRDVRQQITAIKEFNPAGGQPVIWTSYGYDALGQVVTVTDDHDNVTTSTYDNFGRRTMVDSPDAGRTETVYDLADNEIRKITAKLAGQNLAIDYDYEFKRLTAIRYPTFPQNNVGYTYGAPGAAGNTASRISRVTDGAGTVRRTYGPLGEVVTETRTVPVAGGPSRTYTTQYRYDSFNRVLRMTFPDGEVLSYTYNSGGMVERATGVKRGQTYQYLTRLDYDKFDQRVLMDTSNGTRTRYTYNATDRRLARMEAKLSNGYSFQNLLYDYDGVGNVESIVNDTLMPGGQPGLGNELGGPGRQSFTYDDLYRLTSAYGEYRHKSDKVDRYTLALSYDSINNITGKNQRHEIAGQSTVDVQQATTYNYGYSYAGQRPHAPSAIGPYDMAYDPNGNLISRFDRPVEHRRQLIWDEENRLACTHEDVRDITLPQHPTSCDEVGEDPAVRFKYDDQGTRVVKDASQIHIYPNQHYSQRAETSFKHVFIGQTRLLTKIVKPDSGYEDHRYFYHPDHLGSTGFVTDENGHLAEHQQYFASGESWVTEHPVLPVPYQFSGKEIDPETGLYDMGARQYDPRTQVWLTPDPALDAYLNGQPNGGIYNPINLALYAYAYHNPIRLVDPTGLFPWNRVIGGVKLVGGVIEAAAGVAAGAATSWTGVGAVAGGAVALHGVDVAISGARQLWTGEDTSSFTSQGLQAAGVSKSKADLIDAGVSVVGTLGTGALARAGAKAAETTAAQVGTQAAAQSGAPAHLAAGRAFEAAQLTASGLAKNTSVWRPTAEQMSSAAFKVIVGPAKYTAGGKPIGVIVDAVGVEIKGGASVLESTYQLRLMTYRALVTGEKLTIRTSRPVSKSFADWLNRWGVTIEKVP